MEFYSRHVSCKEICRSVLSESPTYTVGLCTDEEAKFQRGPHSSEMAEPGWPESRALPTSPGVGKPLSAEGQMVDILGFVGQTVSVARTELSCYSEKTVPDNM